MPGPLCPCFGVTAPGGNDTRSPLSSMGAVGSRSIGTERIVLARSLSAISSPGVTSKNQAVPGPMMSTAV